MTNRNYRRILVKKIKSMVKTVNSELYKDKSIKKGINYYMLWHEIPSDVLIAVLQENNKFLEYFI